MRLCKPLLLLLILPLLASCVLDVSSTQETVVSVNINIATTDCKEAKRDQSSAAIDGHLVPISGNNNITLSRITRSPCTDSEDDGVYSEKPFTAESTDIPPLLNTPLPLLADYTGTRSKGFQSSGIEDCHSGRAHTRAEDDILREDASLVRSS